MNRFLLFVLAAMSLLVASCATVSQNWLEVKMVGDARMNVNYFVNRR